MYWLRVLLDPPPASVVLSLEPDQEAASFSVSCRTAIEVRPQKGLSRGCLVCPCHDQPISDDGQTGEWIAQSVVEIANRSYPLMQRLERLAFSSPVFLTAHSLQNQGCDSWGIIYNRRISPYSYCNTAWEGVQPGSFRDD